MLHVNTKVICFQIRPLTLHVLLYILDRLSSDSALTRLQRSGLL